MNELNDMTERIWIIFSKSGLEVRLMEDASKALR
jgi:hypothetical protein